MNLQRMIIPSFELTIVHEFMTINSGKANDFLKENRGILDSQRIVILTRIKDY